MKYLTQEGDPIKIIYARYLDETLDCLRKGCLDIHEVSLSESGRIGSLRTKLGIKRDNRFYPMTPLNFYIDKNSFENYLRAWNDKVLENETFEGVFNFIRLLPAIFDTDKINEDNIIIEKTIKESFERARLMDELGIGENVNNIFDNPYYNDQLDLDQQDPDFWDNL